jgi:hypothetical protein
MKNAALFSLLFLLPVVAQPPVVNQRRLQADVRLLSSPSFAGRLSLAASGDLTADWLASEMERIGLEPAASDGSYRQKIPMFEYRLDREHSLLRARRDGTEKVWKVGKGWRGGYPGDVTIDGEVVFVGYGITAPEYKYDDYAGLDVKGKVVLAFDHEPQADQDASRWNGTGNTLHANSRLKALNAQRHGAVALVIMAEPNRRYKTAEDRRKESEEKNKDAKPATAAAASGAGIPAQALQDQEVKIPVLMVEDEAGLFLGGALDLKAKQAKIDGAAQPASEVVSGVKAGITLELKERRRATGENIVGLIRGSDPKLSSETVIISAHYDHDGVNEGKLRPGADDNASGVAGMLEIARLFVARAEKPRRSILFLAVAAEERGLLGATYYSQNPLRPLETTRMLINFDMIGRDEKPTKDTEGIIPISKDTSNEVGLVGSFLCPACRDAAETANQQVGLNLTYKWDRDYALNIFQRADHFPFAAKGVPTMWWFTGLHPDYHQAEDTIEKLNFPKMAKIVQLAAMNAWDFANREQTPRMLRAGENE